MVCGQLHHRRRRRRRNRYLRPEVGVRVIGIFDGIFNNKPQQAAADAQKAGITQGYSDLSNLFGQGRDALNTNYTAGLQPFLNNLKTGSQGTDALNDALGLNGPEGNTRAKAAFANNPAIQSQIDIGSENVLRNQARTGQLNSGKTNVDLQNFAQQTANQGWQNYVSNLSPYLNFNTANAQGVGGMYSGLGAGLNQNLVGQGQAAYGADTSKANAQANADLSKAGVNANIIGGVVGGAKMLMGSFAEGGRPQPGEPAVVGERGPELFVPDDVAARGTTPEFAAPLRRFLTPEPPRNEYDDPREADLARHYAAARTGMQSRRPTSAAPIPRYADGGHVGGGDASPWMQDAQRKYGMIKLREAMGGAPAFFGKYSASEKQQRGRPSEAVAADMQRQAHEAGEISDAVPRGYADGGHYGGYADGGEPPVGEPIMVGERGPELFVPDRPGTVVPNHALPLFQRAGMTKAPPQGGDFPEPPPSRADAAYDTSVARWKGIGRQVADDPLSFVPGMTSSVVSWARDNADPRPGRGEMPLGGPRRQRADADLPPSATPTQGAAPVDINDLMAQRKDLVSQRKSLDTQRATAVGDRDLQLKGGKDKSGKPIQAGRGPAYDAKNAEVAGQSDEMKSLDGQITRLDAMIAQAQKEASPEYQQMMAEGDKAAKVRDDMLANKRKTYEEWAPSWLKESQAFLPAATGALVQGGTAAVQALKNRLGASRWRAVINTANAATNPAEKASLAKESAGFAKQYPEPKTFMDKYGKPYGAAAGLGGAEGFALTNFPEAYNAFLPAQNEERAAYEEYLKRLPAEHPERGRIEDLLKTMPTETPARRAALDYFASGDPWRRGAVGFIEGATGAVTGKTAAGMIEPTFPRPGASRLKSDVAQWRKEANAAAKSGGPKSKPRATGKAKASASAAASP